MKRPSKDRRGVASIVRDAQGDAAHFMIPVGELSHDDADAIRIALIDDDPAVLDSLRLYFERKKLQIDCFSTSEEFFDDC